MANTLVQTPSNFTSSNDVMSVYREVPSPVILEQTTFGFQNGLRELNRMRIRGLLCDAVLATADSGAFRVHKVVLSSCSNYFRTLFTTSLEDKSSGEGIRPKMYFFIPNVSSTILEMIIQFAYSGIVNVNYRNVNKLLPAADQFNVNGIVDACVNFMLKNLNPVNCLGVWRFGKEYFMPELERKAFSYILVHFLEVLVSSDEFLHLKVKYIKEILENSYLNVPNEFYVFMAIKRWCQFKYRHRMQYIPELLLCVRMPLLSISDFKQIMDDPRVYSNLKCIPYINMVSKYILNEVTDLSEVIQDKKAVLMFSPRYPYEFIFAIGGWSFSGPTNIFEVYDCRADLWKMMFMEDFLGARVYHQAVSSGDYVYIIGGNTGTDCLSSCLRFDTRNMKFEEVSPMKEKRCFLSAAMLSGKIYAIGGYDGYDRLQTVEYYDDTKNQWTYVSPMLEKRSDASASALRNRIFVVGGFNGSEFLQSAESYYSEFDQWFLIASMLKCRSGVGCVATGNAVYAIGGYDGEQRLNSVEKYCITNRQWFPTKSMKLARSNFAVALMENKIYVMGGYDDVHDTTTDQSEVFDPAKPQWRSIASLNVGRSGLSTCMHSGITDIKPYIKDDGLRCLLKNAPREDTIIYMDEIY